jgi:hypothetical protein
MSSHFIDLGALLFMRAKYVCLLQSGECVLIAQRDRCMNFGDELVVFSPRNAKRTDRYYVVILIRPTAIS